MYSNCLFEAIKAKLKDPKNVRIHKVPAFLNPNFKTPFPHFYWTNGDKAFEFNSYKPRCFQVLLFAGEVQEHTITEMQEKIKRSFSLYAHRLCKKYGNIFEDYLPHIMKGDDVKKPVLDKHKPEWITILFWRDDRVCTRVIRIEDFGKYPDVITWRYSDAVVAAYTDDKTATFFNEDGYSLE